MVVRVFNRVVDYGQPTAVDALRAEVAFLREENARLRLEPFRPSVSAGHLVSASQASGDEGVRDQLAQLDRLRLLATDATDAAWQGLSEALAIRDALVTMCDEIESAAQHLRRRLEVLAPWRPTVDGCANHDGTVA